MTRADEFILRLLADHDDIALNPSVVAFNTDYTNSYAARRLRALEENGLVENKDNGRAMYQITELGKKYVAGELAQEELEDLNPNGGTTN